MSIMKEIEEKESQIRVHNHKLDLLHEKIKRELNLEEREYYEKEIIGLKDSLNGTEKELKLLHQKNRRHFMFALCLFIIIILIIVLFRL